MKFSLKVDCDNGRDLIMLMNCFEICFSFYLTVLSFNSVFVEFFANNCLMIFIDLSDSRLIDMNRYESYLLRVFCRAEKQKIYSNYWIILIDLTWNLEFSILSKSLQSTVECLATCSSEYPV